MHTCYACGNSPTSDEHVPPKCLFPETKDTPDGTDLRRNLFTVPSCEEHNTHKSGDDEYLFFVLAMNLPANHVANLQVSSKIARAVARRPKLVESMMERAEPVLIADDRTHELYETNKVELDGVRFDRSLRLLALGVYFQHFGKRWHGSLRVQPEFIAFPDEHNSAEITNVIATVAACSQVLFKGATHIGANPSVFSYQVHEGEGTVTWVLRLSFYEGCKVTVFLGIDG
jgi:hypothetical protein